MRDQPVILVTGTSRGIGRYLAQHYGSNGYQVIGCSRSAVDVQDLPNYEHFQLDVSDEKSVVGLFREIRSKHERLDAVINNAAVNPTLSMVAMTSHEKASSAMAINFLGTFLVCREATKLMTRKQFGRIINMASMAVKHEVAGEAIYTASKAAVIAFTRVLAKEVYPLGITCNVVAPSALETDLMRSVPRDALNEVLKRNAIHELGKEPDIANTIDWLLKPESDAITGQVVYLGGV